MLIKFFFLQAASVLCSPEHFSISVNSLWVKTFVWPCFTIFLYYPGILLFTFASKLPLFFSPFVVFSLFVITFSIKNRDRLTKGISSRDSIIKNQGNSVPVSVSESKSFHLCFLFKFMWFGFLFFFFFLFSLGLCSKIRHGIQLLLVIYLFETGVYLPVYSRRERTLCPVNF